MTDDRAKTPRTLLIADHLWDAFTNMAVEMGAERDALMNQALYTFARLNGFLVPSDLKRMSAPPPAADSSRPRPTPGLPPTLMAVPDERPVQRSHGNPERVAEIAQQLAGSNMARSSGPPPPPPASVKAEASPVEVDDSLLGEEGQATSMELPNIAASLGGIKQPPASMVAQHRDEVSDPGTETPGQRMLVLLADGRELDRVVKDRFLIGRGKHCDLIINSGKVSREHAAITREGNVWFIEDLGSSNGTWFDKRRISRRQIQEGDEYFICSEKLSCTFR
jgi:pSer/pThr/pTyr-binding forkhead associated (FHA) protein